MRICFVCLGNICRSPIAEVVMRELVRDAGLEDEIEVSSAGTGDWHVGGPADDRTLAVLSAHGYDGAPHRARQFRREWFDDHDLVIAMDRSNARDLRRMAPAGQADKVHLLMSYDPTGPSDDDTVDVPDPYYGDGDGFALVLDMVERACRGLLDQLRAPHAR